MNRLYVIAYTYLFPWLIGNNSNGGQNLFYIRMAKNMLNEMQQSQIHLPTILSSANCFRNVYHDYGRYKTISDKTFVHNGCEYPINSIIGSDIRYDILVPMIYELEAMQMHYSRVFFTRFDLHLPELTSVKTGNQYIRKLFKKLHQRLKSKYHRPQGLSEPIINFAYGWVREQEVALQPHYHCWIALPHRQVKWFGNSEKGIGGVITEIWKELTSGKATLVNFAKRSVKYPDHYVIYRNNPETLEGPIYWLSYLAKERGKVHTGVGTRIYSTSKLSSKTPHRKPIERFSPVEATCALPMQ